MARAGPRKIAKYGDRFKATAVKLSSLPGVLIQDVAAALDIHPFMLSLWRKQVREGVARAGCSSTGIVPMDRDTYMVSKRSAQVGFGPPLGVKADVYEEANR